jgi:hypothetical protein
MWRLRDATYPDWRTQPEPPPQPSMPAARTAPVTPAYEVFAGLQDELDAAPLPPQADSVLRAANERGAPPEGTPRFGRVVARVQAVFPLTPVLFCVVIAMIALVRVRLWWRARRQGDDVAASVRALRLVSVTGLMLWVGLALITAVSFSAM